MCPYFAADGCNNYTVLSEADRAQGHFVFNASDYRCDWLDLVPGWHRFQGAAGDRMADKCVPEKRCGGSMSGWLNGTHPSIDEGVVTRGVCFSSLYHCCNWFQNIRVNNCGTYFVYELPRPHSMSCALRYCGDGGTGKFLVILHNIFIWQGNRVLIVCLWWEFRHTDRVHGNGHKIWIFYFRKPANSK